jgi:hypothetical protein
VTGKRSDIRPESRRSLFFDQAWQVCVWRNLTAPALGGDIFSVLAMKKPFLALNVL